VIPKQLQTLIACAALAGVTVTESGALGAVTRLTVTRGYGPVITYLAMTGDRLLRLSGSESPNHDPLSAMHWHAACEALADELEALV
jgi:hypothetical protein